MSNRSLRSNLYTLALVNTLRITTPGVAESNKALIVDTNKDLSGIRNLSVDNLNVNGTLLTASAAELNYTDTTPGIAESNRALVVDSNIDITNINNLTANSLFGTIHTASQPNITSLGTLSNLNVNGSLNIIGHNGSTVGLRLNNTLVTATANELNKLAGSIVTTVELNKLSGLLINSTKINYNDITTLGIAEGSKTLVLDSNRDISNIRNLSATNLTGTIQTASQPNITSVGTLVSLTANGNVNIASHNALNTGLFLNNILVTSTAAEINLLTDIQPGTVIANKVLAVDNNKDLLGIRNLSVIGDFNVKYIYLNNALILSTAEEINYLNGIIKGTVSNNKALVVDTNKDLSGIRNLTIDNLIMTGSNLQLPSGNTASRPLLPSLGYIRYNTETSQFEGYGAGNSWGSLGGVINVQQTTKILAENSPGSNDNNLRFINSNSESMRITSTGNVGINNNNPSYKLDLTGTLRCSSTSIFQDTMNIYKTGSNNNSIVSGLVLRNNYNLASLAGLGVGIDFWMPDSSGGQSYSGSLNCVVTNPVTASFSNKFEFKLYNAGITNTAATIDSTGLLTTNFINISGHNGSTSGLQLNGTLITATATELNYNDISTTGIAEALKALILNSSRNITNINNISLNNLALNNTTNYRTLIDCGSTVNDRILGLYNNVTSFYGFGANNDLLKIQSGSGGGGIAFYTDASNTSTGSEKMRIDSTTTNILNTLALNGISVTATATELNYNDITTIGIAEASKALIIDSNKDITSIRTLTATNLTATNLTGTLQTASQPNITSVGTLTSLSTNNITLNGTLITSSASELNTLTGITATVTELNYNDITTIGNAQASKALILDSNRDIINIRNLTATNLTGTIQTASQPNITSVGTLTSLSTGNITLNGTLITSSASELNTLTGITATVTELNYNDISTIGNAEASKALILDSNRDIVNIRNLTATNLTGTIQTASQPNITSLGTLTSLSTGNITLNGTLITSTATELNYNDITTIGTAQASKALILDSNKDIQSIRRLHVNNISIGTLDYTNTDRLITAIDSSIINGGAKYLCLGKQFSTYNEAEWGYFHTSDGSVLNRQEFGFYGANGIFAITAGRKVGINKTNPSYDLDVSGDINLTGSIRFSGTAITATATEINYNDITTIGTAEASKALILDSNRDITNIRNLTVTNLTGTLQTASQPNITSVGTLTSLSTGNITLNGTLITATSSDINKLTSMTTSTTELNYLSGITTGTASASKALILDSNKDISDINNLSSKRLLLGTSTDSTSMRLISALDSTITTGSIRRQITLGKAASANNQLEIGYNWIADGSNSNYLSLGLNNNSSILNILGSGNVGINTITPNYTLDVNGSINSTNIYINGTLITSSATKLNYTDITTIGTAESSKALILDSSRNISNINSLTATNLTGTLQTASQSNITSVGTLTSLSTGNITLNGTLITATASDINKLTSMTTTTTELNYLSGITIGNASASKALIVDSNKDITSIRNLTATNITGTLQTHSQPNITSLGTLTSLSTGNITLNGALITATASDINTLSNVIAGTVSASKALIVDSNKDISGISGLNLTSYLTAITANATFRLLPFSDNVIYLQAGLNTTSGSAADLFIGNYNQSTISSSRKIIFKANGYVGIGLTNPGYHLDVSGSINGTSLYLNGTQITATATELNYNDIITIGNAEASKALILDSNRDIANIRNLTATNLTGTIQTASQPNITSVGTLTSLSTGNITLNGTLITATATELNYNDITTMGIAQANKALILDSNKDISGIRNLTLTGNLTISGTTTTINSTQINLKDNIIQLNSGPSGSYDSGLIIQRYQTSNDNNTGDVINETHKESYTVISVDINTIVLPSSANINDNYYNGWWVKIQSATLGTNQIRQVSSYDGTSKTITLDSVFTTIPTGIIIVNLYHKSFSSMVWQEANKRFVTSYTAKDTSAGTLTILDYADFATNNLNILSTSDSTSSTNGGSLTIAGGASIAKKLYIGSDLSVTGNTTMTGSLTVDNNVIFGNLTNSSSTISFNSANSRMKFYTHSDGICYIQAGLNGTTSSAADLFIGNYNNEVSASLRKFMIKADGKVGIGLLNPSYLLDVNGSINSTSLYINGTQITASATELNYNDITTIGTAEANKALIVDSSRNISNINSLSCTALTVNGSAISASAAELNYLSGIIIGTASASKALVVDTNKDITSIRNLTATNLTGTIQTASQPNITSVGTLTSLSTGNITLNGTLITATAAKINYTDITTIGTAEASKALILDSSRNISNINNISLNGNGDVITLTNSGSANRTNIRFINDARSWELGSRGSTSTNANSFYLYDNTALAYRIIVNSSGSVNIINHNGSSTGLQLNGTLITATANELNVLDGITATTTELNYVDITAIGTAEASKALIVDANKDIIGITNLTATNLTGTLQTHHQPNITSLGTLTSLSTGNITLNGILITSTANELNILDGVLARADEINVLNGISASTAELNILDGVIATTSDINKLATLTTSTTELNYLSGISLGIASASKVLTVDSSRNINNINSLSTTGLISNNIVNNTLTNINYQTWTNDLTTDIVSALQMNNVGMDFGTITNHPIGLITNNTERLLINSGGNISIGNSNNTYKLDVTGDINLTGSLRFSGTAITATATDINKLASVTASATELNYNDITTIGTAEASKALILDSSRNIININSLTATNLTGTIQTASQTNITSVGTLTSLTSSGNIVSSNANSSFRILPHSDNIVYLQAGLNTTTGSSADIFIGNYGQTTSTSSRKIIIKADGKVGFGTTSPDKILEINDSTGNCLRLTYNDNNGSATYYSDFNISSTGQLIISPSSNNANTIDGDILLKGSIIVGKDSNYNLIRFNGTSGDSNSNMTIIGERLYGDIEASELLLFKGNDGLNGSGPDRIRMRSSEFRFQTYTSAEDYSSISDNNNRLFIANDGKIGINTTSPSYQLDVSGDINLTGSIRFSGTASDLTSITGITAGTATANKALIVDTNIDINNIRNLTATNLTGTLQTASQPNITSVGTLTSLSTNSLTLNSTLITATASDINKLASVTASAIELNYNQISMLGMAEASKVLTVNSSLDVTGINSLTCSSLSLSGNKTLASWGTTGPLFNATSNTFTESSTASNTTNFSPLAINSFQTSTLAASNVGVTFTHAANVYIADGPIAGTNATISNRSALMTRGAITVDGHSKNISNWSSAAFHINSGYQTSVFTDTGSSNINDIIGINKFNRALFASNTAGRTMARAATVYILNQPGTSGSNMTITNSHALYIASGNTTLADTTASTSSTTGALVISGGVGIGESVNISRKLTVGITNTSYSSIGTSGAYFQTSNSTITNSGATSSSTVATTVFSSFAQPTLAATNTSVTTTNASTVYIENEPLNGTNMTLSNSYALWVNAGKVLLGSGFGSTNKSIATLTINADTLRSNAEGGSHGLLISAGNTIANACLYMGADNTNSVSYIQSSKVGLNLPLILNNRGGNVGIGLNSPSYTLDVSGDINLTGSLRFSGTAITATASDINKLASITASATELNYNDITTIGTAEASKALILDSSRNIININSLTATNLTGTIQTASQTNITSVGTLTGLTSSGSVSITNSTESTTTNTGALLVSGGIGVTKSVTIGGKLTLGGTATSASAWGITGIQSEFKGTTYTDTTSSGTVSNVVLNSYDTSTIASSSPTTYTNATTMYISLPFAGTNVTMTNRYALQTNGNVLVTSSTPATSVGAAAFSVGGGGGIGAANIVLGTGRTLAAWGTTGPLFTTSVNTTFTDSSTAANTSNNNLTSINSFQSSSIAASNSNVTYSTVANLFIADGPSEGSNVTINNRMALMTSGAIAINGYSKNISSWGSAPLHIRSGRQQSVFTDTGSSNITDHVSLNYFNNAQFASNTSGRTMARTSTVHIVGAPTTSGANLTITNTHALYIASGNTTLADSTVSSSTTSGALVVSGGVGIGGALNVGGTINTTGLYLNNILVNSTSNEINTLSGITAGTAIANKALVLDSSSNITSINSLTATNLTGTLQTASQPNITSVGTLTSLTSSGNIISSNAYASFRILPYSDNIVYLQAGLNTTSDSSADIFIGNYAVATSASSRKIIIKADGKVGINTISPSYQLDVSGDINLTGSLRVSGIASDLTSIAGITAGTATASKALILDSSRNIININSLTATNLTGTLQTASQTNITSVGTLTSLSTGNITLNGTLITATATELNYNDITTIGTAQASKALILDSNKDIQSIRRLHVNNISIGTLDYTNTDRLITAIDSSIINGGAKYLCLGKQFSTYNEAEWGYFHTSDGSTSNRQEFGFFGANGIFAITAGRKVGINNTGPNYDLDVTGDINLTGSLRFSGTAITATATELNYNDITTIGVAQASKALILDSNKDITGIRNLTITGDLIVSGTTTTINSTQINLKDNILQLNSGPSGTYDAGLIIQRYQTLNDTNLGDVVNETYNETYTASSVTTNTIVLPSGGNSNNDYYKNWWIKIASATAGANQVRQVSSYVGSTKTITLSSNFTTLPTGTIVVNLYNKGYSAMIWQESNKRFITSYTAQDSSAGTLTILDYADLATNNLNILSSTDASSSTAGGSLTISGGAAVAKKLYVGTDLSVNGNITLNGTLITATAAELNILDGVTATTAELNYNDITTIGTAEASKALILDSSRNISNINSISLNGFNDVITLTNLGSGNRTNIRFINDARSWELGSRGSTISNPNIFYLYDNTASAYRLTINSSGNVNIVNHNGSSTGLQLNGTLITATAAELNILDGVTATAAELNILDGVTVTTVELNYLDFTTGSPGTAQASKALVLDSSSNIIGINSLTTTTLITTNLTLNGTSITASATELNYNDITTIGTAEASKALILDSNKNIIGINNLTVNRLLLGTSVDSTSTRLISALDSTITTGSTRRQIVLGKAASTNNQIEIAYNWIADGSSSNYLSLGLYGTASILNILGSGNVGIGITSPGYTLDVVGDINLSGNYRSGGNIVSFSAISGVTNGTAEASKALILDSSSYINGINKIVFNATSTTRQVSSAGDYRCIDTNTITFNNAVTAASGTDTAHQVSNFIGRHTITATNTNVTTTTFSTFYIQGEPLNGTNMTITNKYALYINSGNSYLSGNINIAGHNGSSTGLQLNGTLVTATAAEINKLDGVTATTTELNYLDITSAGTAQASKALVLDSSSNITGINNLSISGVLNIGIVGSGPNRINFSGTTSDASSNHTVIAERIYGGTEQSELLIFKGNDPTSTSGPDRIRLRASEFRFQTYTSTEDFSGLLDNNDRLFINNTGNIGIGTTSPQGFLDFGQNASNYTINLWQNGTGVYGFGANDNAVKYLTSGTNGHVWYTGSTLTNTGSERMRIMPSGNVGIGTTNPTYKLEVSGTTYSSGAITTGDYVFTNLYSTTNANIVGNWPSSNYWGIGYDSTLGASYNTIRLGICSSTGTWSGYANLRCNSVYAQGSISLSVAAYAYYRSDNVSGTSGAATNNYAVYANGRIACNGEINVISDYRSKNNIEQLDNNYCKNFINNTIPVKFNYNNDQSQKHFGYIAQEVYKAGFTDLVALCPQEGLEEIIEEDGFVNPKDIAFVMSTNEIIPILAKNIKIIYTEKEILEEKINNLENENQQLKDQIENQNILINQILERLQNLENNN